MLSPNDVILLLEKWTRRFVAVDIRKTDIGDDMVKNRTSTDMVHHVSEIEVTTDACLDSMTVQAQTPPSNMVNVIPGKVQWFEQLIEITESMESPPVPPFTTTDCDPLITDPIRWSLLCIKQDTQGNNVLFWEHGTPGLGFPEVPYLGVPLALIKTTLGAVTIEQEDILNWRSIRPGYAPGAKFQYPPVMTADELMQYDDPVEGAQCFVLSAGNYYYYKDGAWHTAGLPSFDNTAWYRDIEKATTRIDLPWPLKSHVEVLVFRDGQLMLLSRDYLTMVGPASYLQFKHLLLPGQRIVVLRNPFMSMAFSGSGSDAVGVEQIDIYVDGEIGNDTWEGSEVNPFKTLQRAFDYIPLHSMRIYVIHAKNLKAADIITIPETGDTTYGYARGKQAVTIKLDIENSIESKSVTAVAVLYECSYIAFDATPVEYSIDLINCLSGFSETPIQDIVNIHGGFTTMVRVVGNLTAGYLSFMDGATARVADCAFHNLHISHFAYVRAAQCTVFNLTMEQRGMMYALWCTFTDAVTVTDSVLQMANATIRAEGTFTHGFVSAVNCTNEGNGFTPVPPFFRGTHGSVFYLRNAHIDVVNDYGISLAHSSSLHMEEGYILHSKFDGVLVSFGSSAHLVGVRVANNERSGVRGDYNSTIEFEGCTGGDNKRWGCECYNLSRAYFQTLGIWGNLGGYYEQIPGADTVVSQLGVDMNPGALDTKIVVGKGLKCNVVPGTGAGDYKFRIDIDKSTIAGPGSSYIINTNERQNVFTRYSPIIPASPDTDMPIRWSGQGYMSSVCQRIYDPTTRSKLTTTNLANRGEFAEMDETIGTDFLSDRATLHYDPILGYPAPLKYYWFASRADGMGVVTIYGTQEVSRFKMVANAPTGTEIHVAFSTGGTDDWRVWNAAMMTWDLLPGGTTYMQMVNAPLHTTVLGWNPICWDLLRFIPGQAICVCFLLVTTSSAVTPEVFSYTWEYVEDGFLKDITHMFDRRYFNNRAIFSYTGSVQIDPPIVFSVIPTSDRDS